MTVLAVYLTNFAMLICCRQSADGPIDRPTDLYDGVDDPVECCRPVGVRCSDAADRRTSRSVLGDAEVVRGSIEQRPFIVDVDHPYDKRRNS